MNAPRACVAAVAVLAVWASLGAPVSQAADWPQLGGDGSRNAVSPEKGAPLHWRIKRKAPAQNVKWTAELGTQAFASPVVAGGLVWVGTNNERPRDPRVKGDASVLMCFRERDGRFLWQYVSPRLKDAEDEDFPRASLNCSPLAEGDRLYFTTNRVEVVCLDVAPLRAGKGEPKVVWKLDMRKELGIFRRSPPMNLSWISSPSASFKGRLYVITGNGVGSDWKTVPAPKAPSLVCLDRDTGKVLWSDSSPGKNILVGQWSSPLVAEVGGRGQVIAAQGDGWLRSFDPLTGELLWKFDLNPKKARPYVAFSVTGERNFPLATPVLYDNRVYIATGQLLDDGDGVGHLWCIDPTRKPANKEKDVSPVNDNFDPKAPVNKDSALVWHHGGYVVPKPKEDERDVVFGRSMSTVAVHDGLVIAPDVGGFVHCLDARTGKLYWAHDTEEPITASPLIVDGKVYVPSALDVWVLALSRTKRVLASNRAPGVYPPSLVFANGALYSGGDSRLHALHEAGEGEAAERAGHWPQWRGTDRLNRSGDTALLEAWPKEGPPLLWQVNGIGEGVGAVAVAAGKVYVLGHRKNFEHLTAMEEATGKPLWSVPLAPAVKENSFMRWLSQRTPLVDDERVSAVTATGDLVCLRAATGKRLWRKSYPKDFAGRRGGFGVCDQLLVDGDRLICVPGGKSATVVALDKRTGATIWKAPLGDTAAYVGAVLVGGAGVRKHYIAVTLSGLVGVSTEGKRLWRHERFRGNTALSYTPNVLGNRVLWAGNYGRGAVLLELSDAGEGVEVKEIYHRPLTTPAVLEMLVCVGEHAYVGISGGLCCLAWKSGEVLWQDKLPAARGIRPPFSGTHADGRLYLRSHLGRATLARATPKGLEIHGTLSLPEAKPGYSGTTPVVTGGRLYLRDEERLFCFDVRNGGKPGKPVVHAAPPPATTEDDPAPAGRGRGPDAIYVPTPADVVEKMLDLAAIKKTETVVDLGCGDGRIVVAAARKHGCKAIGYDIDPECIRMAEESVKKHGVGALVTIVRKDFFTVDLSKADVVALYLPPGVLTRLLPLLERLPAGARVVSHAFALPGVEPERTVPVTAKEDGVERKLFLYRAPLRKTKAGK
jgi:outer membrane protein assembly factor BamB